MFDVIWDAPGEKRYETGLDRGVLYPPDRRAVPWNGLTSVDEDSDESDSQTIYFDGVKRLSHVTPGDFSGTLKALTYPDEFLKFDGYLEVANVAGIQLDNQYRRTFGLSYRTYVGNDEDGLGHGYKIHLLYNLTAEPSSKSRETISSIESPNEFSWDISGVPITISGRKATAHIIVDTRLSYPETIVILENILYGNATEPGRLPSAAELEGLTLITVVDNLDGTGTISGPDQYIYPIDLINEAYQLDIFGMEFIDQTTVILTDS